MSPLVYGFGQSEKRMILNANKQSLCIRGTCVQPSLNNMDPRMTWIYPIIRQLK